jgi:hypothetical protein
LPPDFLSKRRFSTCRWLATNRTSKRREAIGQRFE